jgi:hypothetical protein
MAIGEVCTDRFVAGHDHPSWHLVHEWEDEIAAWADVPIVDARDRVGRRPSRVTSALSGLPGVSHAITALDSMREGDPKSFYFAMTPQGADSLSASPSVIPMIVDFWKTVSPRSFHRTYRRSRLVLISSLEAFEFLKGLACPLNLRHFPLSLPDKYRLVPGDAFDKKYDVVIAGRSSPVLVDFMERYAREHPEVEYVYRLKEDDGHRYASNKSGPLGGVGNRAGYMSLLRAARVGLYATPGLDGGEGRTGGFNPVTPRLLELLAAGCHVLARYPVNADTDFYGLQAICPSIDTYASFSDRLEASLAAPPPTARNAEYLRQHYTSNRAELLDRLIKEVH